MQLCSTPRNPIAPFLTKSHIAMHAASSALAVNTLSHPAFTPRAAWLMGRSRLNDCGLRRETLHLCSILQLKTWSTGKSFTVCSFGFVLYNGDELTCLLNRHYLDSRNRK